jgi:iron-sulfur cluster repair protein YtfE (RIC family)
MTVVEQDRIDFTMMYATHHAFRRDLDRLMSAAANGAGGTASVREGWENFKIQLLLHHSVEDTHLWPQLRLVLEGRPGDLALIDEMEAEHAQLDPLLAAVDAALDDRLNTLADVAQKVAVTLRDHLTHEEDDALPLMQSVLTQADWHRFTAQMRRRQGIRGAAVYVPWVLDGAPMAERKQFLGALPAPVRLIARQVWEPRYRNRNRWNSGLPLDPIYAIEHEEF